MTLPLRRRTTAAPAAALAAAALLLALLPASGASAQAAPPTIAVEQGYGFATVSWSPVADADAYEIERSPVDGDEPSGPGEVVGVWTPDRYPYTGGQLTFADSGFALGGRYRWRVRAVVDGTAGEWSAPVVADTQEIAEPGALLTPFEASGGVRLTTHEEEVAWLEAVAAASERVRLETIAHTYQGRPVHLVTVGLPTPAAREEIAASPAVLITCTVHGGERAPREACMILLRQLAFSDDPWVTRILSQTTVLIVPTLNPDGQVTATRTNTAGQDLNRDHLLLRHPETFAVAEVIRDHRPELVFDAHELGTGADLAHLWPRSPNVSEGLFRLTQDHMTREHAFHREAEAGWSARPWPTHRTDNW
ncbi:MAG TPA: M14 family zinc carboxypeptidase, partial [Egibacteraceae bacterium]